MATLLQWVWHWNGGVGSLISPEGVGYSVGGRHDDLEPPVEAPSRGVESPVSPGK